MRLDEVLASLKEHRAKGTHPAEKKDPGASTATGAVLWLGTCAEWCDTSSPSSP